MEARAACGGIYAEILRLPFLRELAAGTLAREAFERYLRQDALYLAAYARAMGRLAERLGDEGDRALFRHFAEDGVAAERAMQEEYGVAAAGEASPACRRSTAHVERMGEEAPLAVAAAGVLPCFAVYAEVGEWLAEAVRAENPYGRWIGAYAGGDFAGDAAAAAKVCDGFAEREPGMREAMLEAYREGVVLERDFWAEAWRGDATHPFVQSGGGVGGDVPEEFFGGGGVEAGHGVADVDEEVVAGGGVGEEGEGDALADAAVVDKAAAVEAFAGVDFDQAAGDGEAHGSVSGVGEGVAGREEG